MPRPVTPNPAIRAEPRSVGTARARDPLAREVRLLGALLGQVIAEQEGPAALDLVERVRGRAIALRRRGGPAGGRGPHEGLAALDVPDRIDAPAAWECRPQRPDSCAVVRARGAWRDIPGSWDVKRGDARRIKEVTMLSSSTIKRLADDGPGLRVSLYLPTHRAGSETAQDPIRLKNLLTRAAAELEEVGARSAEIDAMLKPARALLDDVEFWAHQADGLAVLLAGGDLEALRLPLTVDELAVVADRFHLKPLLPLLSGDGRFHVLALSQNQVRLFEGSREAIREVDLRDIPQSLRDVVGYDWDESSLQFHTGTSRMGGRRAAMFHGDGSPKNEAKPEIAAFLRVVDDGITHLLGPVDVPVVLAAVEYVASIYRQITKLPRVMAEVVEGSPDRVPLTELHARAWGIVAPGFSAERDAAAERFRSLTSTDLATTDLASTVARAMEGRIDTLFIAVGVSAWGRPRTAHRDLEIHPERQPGDRDLFDVAAVHALLTDARVYAVSPELMPVADEAIAAILRY